MMQDMVRVVLMLLLFLLAAVVPNIFAADTSGVQTSGNCRILPEKDRIFHPLPDPGMLLNNRIYFLKTLRDTLLDAFIRSPVKNVDFHILQADKFLSMALALFRNTEDWVWVPEALSRSRKSAYRAYELLQVIQKNGQPLPSPQLDTLKKSIGKHRDTVGEMRCHTISPDLERAFAQDDKETERLLSDVFALQ